MGTRHWSNCRIHKRSCNWRLTHFEPQCGHNFFLRNCPVWSCRKMLESLFPNVHGFYLQFFAPQKLWPVEKDKPKMHFSHLLRAHSRIEKKKKKKEMMHSFNLQCLNERQKLLVHIHVYDNQNKRTKLFRYTVFRELVGWSWGKTWDLSEDQSIEEPNSLCFKKSIFRNKMPSFLWRSPNRVVKYHVTIPIAPFVSITVAILSVYPWELSTVCAE